MTTMTHASGNTTVVHTSKFAEAKQSAFLRRSGFDESTIALFYANTAKSQEKAHAREDARISYCNSLGMTA